MEPAASLSARHALARLWSRLIARLGPAEHLMVQRLAGAVFLIRVVSALLAYGSQVLFARWMGSFEFGIYVYVTAWVLLLGPALDLGLGTTAQRFIPEYRNRGMFDLLRGFIYGSRVAAFGSAIVIAAACASLVWALAPWLDDYAIVPLYLAWRSLQNYFGSVPLLAMAVDDEMLVSTERRDASAASALAPSTMPAPATSGASPRSPAL